jgi:hypothetical protein
MPQFFRLLSLLAPQEDTIAELSGQPLWGLEMPDQPYSCWSPFPFTVSPSAATSGDGFFIAPREGSSILEYDTSGEVNRILRIDEPSRVVTQADIDAYVDDPGQFGTPAFRRSLGFPDEMAAFQLLLVDEAGWLWAKLFGPRSTDPSSWVIFDLDGRAHGTVELPADLEVHQIGPDFVLGFVLDEFGVPVVRKYRLHRN